jgi:hypothetical protein
MRDLGLALIVIAVLALLVVWSSALSRLPGLAWAESWVYAAAPILLLVGVVLVAFGSRRAGT